MIGAIIRAKFRQQIFLKVILYRVRGRKRNLFLSRLFLSLWDTVLWHCFPACQQAVCVSVCTGNSGLYTHPRHFQKCLLGGFGCSQSKDGCLPPTALWTQTATLGHSKGVLTPSANSVTDNMCIKHRSSSFLMELLICLLSWVRPGEG